MVLLKCSLKNGGEGTRLKVRIQDCMQVGKPTLTGLRKISATYLADAGITSSPVLVN